jgi:hypothetical protein
MLQEVLQKQKELEVMLEELTCQVSVQNTHLWNSVLTLQRTVGKLEAISGGASPSSALAIGLSSAQEVPPSFPSSMLPPATTSLTSSYRPEPNKSEEEIQHNKK